MSHRETFYITTAIDYPNSVPHMGHAYEKVVADFYARAARLRGQRTRFLIGLDEHGQKIQEAAAKAGKPPREFVDEKAVVFRDLYRLLSISHDDFIRTSEPRHHAFARAIFERARDAGDIYQGVYEGDYCISCEKALSRSELVDGKCPVHDRETTKIEEASYFFRLGKYREKVREHILGHPGFIVPAERRNEILSRLEDEVLDLSISRSTFDWGVPLPGDDAHVLYVWFDALSNYYSALTAPEDLTSEFWPAACHVIGKDILWFHTVIWPAMLLSAGYALPEQVYAHGFILDKDGRKMAKQLGNVVDPLEVAREYSVDVLRYYFLRSFSSGQDGKFSVEELEERYNRELANDLGNLILRLAKLAETRLDGAVASPGSARPFDHAGLVARYFELVDGRDHHRALDEVWAFVRGINAYLNDQAPWKLKETAPIAEILGHALDALRTALHLLEPALPNVSRSAAASLGFEITPRSSAAPASWPLDGHAYQVVLGDALFPRRDPPAAASGSEGAPTVPDKPVEKKTMTAGGTEKDPFAKLDLRAGVIVEARDHPDADKLFALMIDLGEESPRSVCAGLREHLQAEDLLGRKVLVVANLKPASMRGIESRGMVLATDLPDGRVLPVDPGGAEPGAPATVPSVESSPKKKLSRSEFEAAPLTVEGGRVCYRGDPLETSAGPIRVDAKDGSPVR